jgi:hypothetical protein
LQLYTSLSEAQSDSQGRALLQGVTDATDTDAHTWRHTYYADDFKFTWS